MDQIITCREWLRIIIIAKNDTIIIDKIDQWYHNGYMVQVNLKIPLLLIKIVNIRYFQTWQRCTSQTNQRWISCMVLASLISLM